MRDMQLSSALVELPENFQTTERQINVVDGKTLDHPEDGLVFTTLPARYFGEELSEYPDGWTECLFNGPIGKRAVLKTPGFPQPLVQPHEVGFCIKETPGMGFGMFAARDLEMGDLILSERPLIMTPHGIPPIVSKPIGCTDQEYYRIIMAEWERNLQLVFGRLSQESQTAFLALDNSHTEDGSGPLLGRIRTNGFGYYGVGGKGVRYDYSTVFKHMSRINHR
jgi:hypothetical protein